MTVHHSVQSVQYIHQDRLKLEVEKRDAEIAQLIHQMEEQDGIPCR